MSKLLIQAQEAIVLWRLKKAKFWLFTLMSMGSSWQVATANVKVSTLNSWDFLEIGVGTFVAWATTMMAFVDKTAGEISHDLEKNTGAVTVTTETKVETPTNEKTNP